MKTFKNYLAESAKSYYVAIKLAVKPTEAQLATIEDALKRYELRDLQGPDEIHDTDDFYDMPHSAVHCMRAELGSPVSSYNLMQNLRKELNISEKMLVVRNSNEPFEIEAEDVAFFNDAEDKAIKAGMKSRARLSTNREYDTAEQPEVTDLYGNSYNKKLLDYLSDVAARRPSKEIDAPAPLFSWLQMQDVAQQEPAQDTADFNANHDTPKPVLKPRGEVPVNPERLGPYGNLDDRATKNVKLLRTKTGKAADATQTRALVKGNK